MTNGRGAGCAARTHCPVMDDACLNAPLESSNPFLEVMDSELASLCAARARALQSLSWATEAERAALRAGTALLLEAVSLRLGAHGSTTAPIEEGSLAHLNNLIHEPEHGPLLAARSRQ